MKLLVVLVLFSVCNANILWREPPKTNLEVVKDAFWDYVAKATQTAEESLKQIRESELGQEVNTKISQSADAVNQYIVSLQTQAAPLTQDFLTRFNQEAEQLKTRLENDLTALGSSIKPYGEQLMTSLQSRVEELKKEATPLAEAVDPEALKAVLLQKSQELKGQLESGVTQLQAHMVPHTEEVREKMEQSLQEFQGRVTSLAQSFETQVAQKSQEIQQSLVPYGEDLRASLDGSAQDLKNRLAALWASFTQKTQ
ncbi:PREDICTED: apolipoprotein A-IV-like [Cyprinodon variegatus]|uniref:Apolipoprotein A-IV n=1 Tax=Cyprinodon variegatus TaxID=28743 RepID=A0A3Q2CTA7_CYPVA|nr:PREDICTED: apolipoprotein A-IV-like [Cyprinodon variegatus]